MTAVVSKKPWCGDGDLERRVSGRSGSIFSRVFGIVGSSMDPCDVKERLG